ncbi:unnamed protein product [Mytilus edulis]|uniref:Uncharacterized protein n=1 Tax=Mytilus edulis TaxID=6550 RepID=A0A8S3TYD2_MYTED|nr:unnamed protein product [Mytilus edulis]
MFNDEMGTIVLLMCVMIFIPEVAYGSSNWQYGAILDAGSSSTKLKIYRWPQNFFRFCLRHQTKDDARSLMNAIRNVLQNKTLNPFVFNPSNVRILSGEEEGVFAWITINYLKDYFGSDRPQSQAVGVLEMGGGSTQIVFLPDGPLLAKYVSGPYSREKIQSLCT